MNAHRTCPVVGLVGGVGSGKSTLARCAAERFGLAVVDGDAVGHRALENSDVRIKLRNEFGDSIFRQDGGIDRQALASLVFGPAEEHTAAKARLEEITHPLITKEFDRQIEAARAAKCPAVLLDAAVLFESGWRTLCDAVVFIDVPASVRQERVTSRGWSVDRWKQREASQWPLEKKRLHADAVIQNTGTPEIAVLALGERIQDLCGVKFPEMPSVRDVAAVAHAP